MKKLMEAYGSLSGAAARTRDLRKKKERPTEK